MKVDELVIVRGAGDLATGTIIKLKNSGFRVIALETKNPSTIRRSVSLSPAVTQGSFSVEGRTARLVWDAAQALELSKTADVPILIDPNMDILNALSPDVLIDATIAKKNMGMSKDLARTTIALGPGFEAGKDVDFVIETMRGHELGRIIPKGFAQANTGIPGSVNGHSADRVIHSPKAGTARLISNIGDLVQAGEVIMRIEEKDGNLAAVRCKIGGVLRGLIAADYPVYEGMKIADVDADETSVYKCYSISEKARCIAGGVLEAILSVISKNDETI